MNSDGIAYVPPILTGRSGTATSEPIVHSNEQTGPAERAYSPLSHINPSDESLLSEVGEGSKEALGILFRRHRRTVSNVALRILKDASEAEDLGQEVFIFVFQRAKLFDASKGTAISWIIQIAYHRAINRRRYLTVRQHYNAQELDEEQLASDRQHLSIDDIDARKLLDRFRDQLTPDQWCTLELHFFEGYSFREIAEKTTQTIENTRHHFYRGLERLRSCVFPHKRV